MVLGLGKPIGTAVPFVSSTIPATFLTEICVMSTSLVRSAASLVASSGISNILSVLMFGTIRQWSISASPSISSFPIHFLATNGPVPMGVDMNSFSPNSSKQCLQVIPKVESQPKPPCKVPHVGLNSPGFTFILAVYSSMTSQPAL